MVIFNTFIFMIQIYKYCLINSRLLVFLYKITNNLNIDQGKYEYIWSCSLIIGNKKPRY